MTGRLCSTPRTARRWGSGDLSHDLRDGFRLAVVGAHLHACVGQAEQLGGLKTERSTAVAVIGTAFVMCAKSWRLFLASDGGVSRLRKRFCLLVLFYIFKMIL